MTWHHNDQPFTSDQIGEHVSFVYRIDHLPTNRSYIGKKGFWSTRTLPPLKGQKRKRKKITESDWQSYHGSNPDLKALAEIDPAENFRRTIIRICKSKGEATYFEAKAQFDNDVLLFPERWFNGIIACKVSRSHIKETITKAANLNISRT